MAIILLLTALMPWLQGRVKSIELPGGFKIKFFEVQSAGEKISRAQRKPPPGTEKASLVGIPSYLAVVDLDPNLALVGLRIEIEQRLRALANFHGLDTRLPLAALFRELQGIGALAPDAITGWKELISAGNRAAHGARVDDEVTKWATDVAPTVLEALDVNVSS